VTICASNILEPIFSIYMADLGSDLNVLSKRIALTGFLQIKGGILVRREGFYAHQDGCGGRDGGLL
jgi:hypothetical protein